MIRDPNAKGNRPGMQYSPLVDTRIYPASAFFLREDSPSPIPDAARVLSTDEAQPAWDAQPDPAPATSTGFTFAREPLLITAIVVSVLIMMYELAVIALKPSWAPIATDWVRATLSWVQLLPVLLAAIILYRHRKPGALAWSMFTLAMLSYAIAQTTWAVLDRIVEPNNVPVPSQADVFYLIQYPFFFLGLALLPGLLRQGRPSIARAKIVLDCLLLMAAGTALSYYFILAPFYLQSGQSFLGKATNLAYPVGDLGLLFGLAIVIISQNRNQQGQSALRLFIAAVASLIIADSIFLNQQLYPAFNPGDLPNGFWMTSYLLFGLAGLIRFRAVQREVSNVSTAQHVTEGIQEVTATKGFQSLVPFIAAVLASVLIVFRAAMASATPQGDKNLLVPFVISFGLLILIGARQGITVLENERLLQTELQRSKELDQAKQMAEKQRLLLAERNQRLQTDIQILKEIHARVARGDYTARVPITSGELLPIAGSLNIMLDRLSNLIRASSEYARLEQAIQQLAAAAHSIAEGDEQALLNVGTPTNTALDGMTIALRQVQTRVKDVGVGLQKLDHARKTTHELSEITTQQNQNISSEGRTLSNFAGTLNHFTGELARIIQMLERSQANVPINQSMVRLVAFLRTLAETLRQQHTEITAQVMRFNQLEADANAATIGLRRLSSDLETMAQNSQSRITPPNNPYRSRISGKLTRNSAGQ